MMFFLATENYRQLYSTTVSPMLLAVPSMIFMAPSISKAFKSGIFNSAISLILLREILNNKDLGIHPIGFIDDDDRKVGKKIQGYPVLGNLKNAKKICSKHRIAGIIVAFKNDSTAKTEQLDALCREHEVFLKSFSITLEDI